MMSITTAITCIIAIAALAIYIIYKLVQYYSNNIRYLTFIEDIVNNDAENLILRFSSEFWFSAFKARADVKTLNIVLRRIGHAVYNGSSLESRPYVIGMALGKLATINKKCEVRAIQYCTSLSISTNSAHFIISLMEENSNIPGKKFISVLKQLSGEPREELLIHLSKSPATKKFLVLL